MDVNITDPAALQRLAYIEQIHDCSRIVTIQLLRPVCAENGARAAISRKIANRWRLIGYGIIEK